MDKYELKIGTDGKGFLDYYWDSWLVGSTRYSLVNIDYDGGVIAWGCNEYFAAWHYQYFWVMHKDPVVSFD